MKILALDIGDKWIGTALSDVLQITCKPYKTITLENLESFLVSIVPQENINTIIIGHPITMGGKASLQTKKIEKIKEQLELKYLTINNIPITWILWDERLSSKRALSVLADKKKKLQKEKPTEHAIAAAFILQSYLDNKALHQ